MEPQSPAWKLAESGQKLSRAARDVLLGVVPSHEHQIVRATRLVVAALDELGSAPASEAGGKIVPSTPGALAYAQGAGEIARRMLPPAALAPMGDASAEPASTSSNVCEPGSRAETPAARGSTARSPRGSAPSEKHVLALSGRESSIAPPDLIGFLCSQRKSGILEVETSEEAFLLEIADGDVVHAQSDRTPEGQRLGDVLVAQGTVARERLEAFRARVGGSRLGAALVEEGLVTREQLLGALQVQIQKLFQRLFEAHSTSFAFWSGPPIHAEARLRMNATSLMLESARMSDERNRLAGIQ